MGPDPLDGARILKATGTTLHRQLFLMLREQIVRGTYGPGAALPNEVELCRYFGVSRITVRRALADLQALGLIERYAGRGTFVSERLPRPHLLDSMSFLQALEQAGRETQVKVLGVHTAVPPGAVALQMQLPSGEQAVYAARLRHSGTTPLMVTEAWVPMVLGAKLTAARLRKRPLYDLLLSQGIEFGRVIEEITAVTADPRFARLLDTEVGLPLLRLTRLVYDRSGRPVEHLTVHLSPMRSRILLNVPPDGAQTSVASRVVHDLAMKGQDVGS